MTKRRDGVAGGGEERKGKWSAGKIHAVLASLSNSINTAYSWVTGKSPAAATPTSAREREEREREKAREQEWVKRKKGVKREGVYERQAQKRERTVLTSASAFWCVCVCVSEVCGGTVPWSWATAVKAWGGGRRGECCALEFSTGKRNNTNPAPQITSDRIPSEISVGSTPLALCRKLWAHLIETGPGE